MNRKSICLAAIPFLLSASVVHAAEVEMLTIKKQTSHYMSMHQTIKRIAVGNPDIATVIQLPGSATEFLVVTKENVGSTSLFVWTIDGSRYEYLIVVSPEDPGRAKMIQDAIGLPNVRVKMVDDRILLAGTVKNQYEKNYALQTARLFVNGNTESSLLVGSGFDMKLETTAADDTGRSETLEAAKSENKGTIIDLIQILNPTQIRLEAQIIEINSEDAKDLGIQYGTTGSGGIFYFGEDYTRTDEPRTFHNNPARWVEQHFSPINATITALVTKGKARVLSHPSVTTLSGEQATIQIGGEIPYSTTNSNGYTNTSFKKYGIILQVRPVVDSRNRITSMIHAEVSNMSGQTVDNQPIISTRSADSVINIFSGGAVVIGGLMDSSETKNVSKIPLLGDIPVLGEFFKHTSKTRDKRELIIVVTPYIIEDENELSQTPMTDNMRDFYDAERDAQERMKNYNFKTANEPF